MVQCKQYEFAGERSVGTKPRKIVGFNMRVQLATYTCESTFVCVVVTVMWLRTAMSADKEGQGTFVVWDMPQDVTTLVPLFGRGHSSIVIFIPMLPSLPSSVFLAMRDRVRSVVEIDFGQRLIEFDVRGYRDGLDRIRYRTMGGGLRGVLRVGLRGWIMFGIKR